MPGADQAMDIGLHLTTTERGDAAYGQAGDLLAADACEDNIADVQDVVVADAGYSNWYHQPPTLFSIKFGAAQAELGLMSRVRSSRRQNLRQPRGTCRLAAETARQRQLSTVSPMALVAADRSSERADGVIAESPEPSPAAPIVDVAGLHVSFERGGPGRARRPGGRPVDRPRRDPGAGRRVRLGQERARPVAARPAAHRAPAERRGSGRGVRRRHGGGIGG